MYSNENIEYLLDLGNHFLSRAKNAIKKDDVLDDDDKNQMIDVVKSNDIKNFYKMDTIVRDHLIIALSSEFNFLCADELSEIADMLRNYYDMLLKVQMLLPPAHRGNHTDSILNMIEKLSDMEENLRNKEEGKNE